VSLWEKDRYQARCGGVGMALFFGFKRI